MPDVMVPALQRKVNEQRLIIRDLRSERYVTQGAFMAAQLLKADKGVVKFQRTKLDRLCYLLVSAGVLEESSDGLVARGKGSTERTAMVVDDSAKQLPQEIDIERVEKMVRRAQYEAQRATDEIERATKAVAEAMAKTGVVAAQCAEIDKKCSMTAGRCSGLEEAAKNERQRVETNSTRIYNLAAEVERVAERESAVHEPSPRTSTFVGEREELFAKKIATPQASCEEGASQSSTERTPTKIPGENAEHNMLVRRAEASNPINLNPTMPNGTVETVPTESFKNLPRRPGALESPGGDISAQNPLTRAALLTINPGGAPCSTTSRRATYVGRRVVPGMDREQMVDPIRPRGDRPRAGQATPNSWARASWPSLTSESADHTRVGADHESCDDSGHRVSRKDCIPGLLSPEAHDVPLKKRTIDALDGVLPAKDPFSTLGSKKSPRGLESDRSQSDEFSLVNRQNDVHRSAPDVPVRAASPHSWRHSSAEKTELEEDEIFPAALAPVEHSNLGRRYIDKLELDQTISSAAGADDKSNRYRDRARETAVTGNHAGNVDSEGAQTGSLGTRLVFLDGAPNLWCPCDTWAAATGSSTVESGSTGGFAEDFSTTVSESPVGKDGRDGDESAAGITLAGETPS